MQGCFDFVPSLIEIGPVILERMIFNFRLCILLFRNYLPLRKGVALYLNRFRGLVKNSSVVMEKKMKI